MNIYIAVAIPVIIAFLLSVALGPVIIPFLRKLKFGQTVRDDGPQSHLKKNGTPTMGGLIFLISVIVTSCIYVKDYPQIIPILFVTVGFGVIGFLDDYIKIVLKRSVWTDRCNWCICRLHVQILGNFHGNDRSILQGCNIRPWIFNNSGDVPCNYRNRKWC